MLNSSRLVLLFLVTLSPSVATGIDELLGKSTAVVEGAVLSTQVTGSETTLMVEIGSVLLGPVKPGDTISVACNTLKDLFRGIHPDPYAYSKIFFLRLVNRDGWACVPVEMRGYSAIGYLGYPQAPPCPQGDLRLLSPKSVRQRILTRVAESALCGARYTWSTILDASSPAVTPEGSPGSRILNGGSDFDRRLFRELLKSSRRDIHMDAMQALFQLGDSLPFDLVVRNFKEYQGHRPEWLKIRNTVEGALEDASVIPQLARLLAIPDADLRLAVATALQRFHTPAAVVLLGKMLEAQDIEKQLALVAAKGLSQFANGCSMMLQSSLRTPADYFPRCDEKAPFRTEETVKNTAPGGPYGGDETWHITFWKYWWSRNGPRVAALAAQ